jgi:hypothetical protein
VAGETTASIGTPRPRRGKGYRRLNKVEWISGRSYKGFPGTREYLRNRYAAFELGIPSARRHFELYEKHNLGRKGVRMIPYEKMSYTRKSRSWERSPKSLRSFKRSPWSLIRADTWGCSCVPPGTGMKMKNIVRSGTD